MAALASISAIELQEHQSLTIHFKGLDGKIKAIHCITMDQNEVTILLQAGEFFPVRILTMKDTIEEEN